MRDATLRNIELIGEAATRTLAEIGDKYADIIPWRMIIATRNRLIHGHLGTDDDTHEDVPNLLRQLRSVKGRL